MFKSIMKKLAAFAVATVMLSGYSIQAFAMEYEKPVSTWPNRGGYYGWLTAVSGTYHVGTDIAAPAYSDVYAVRDGVVRVARKNVNGYGRLNPSEQGPAIVIEHKDDGGTAFYALYGHVEFDATKIYNGANVKKGDVIGYIIPFYNGSAYCPHLHFAINTKSASVVGNIKIGADLSGFVDPVAYLATVTVPAPQIISAYPKQSTVKAGDNVAIYAKTNGSVTKVQLLDEKNAVICTVSNPTTNKNNEKEWDFTWNAKDSGTRALKLRATAGERQTDYPITVVVTAAPAPAEPKVISAKAKEVAVTLGDTLYFYAKTNDAVDKVNITDSKGAVLVGTTVPTTNKNGEKEWDLAWKPTTVGDNYFVKINAYVGTKYVTYTLSVNVKAVPTPAPAADPKIISARAKQTTVAAGAGVDIYAKTNSAVTKVELINERGEIVGGSSVPTTDRNNEREWDFVWQTRDAGYRVLNLRAYAGTKTASTTISVTINAPAAKPKVNSISPSNTSPMAGETIAVTVYTNTETTKVCLVNERQEMVAEATSGGLTVNGQKKWTINWGIADAGNRQIAVYAGDGAGYQWEREYMDWFFVTVRAATAQMMIFSVAVANPTVQVGDFCWLTAVTSPDITDVWIVNETNGETVYDLVRSYPVGSNKGWDIGWQLGRAGSRTGYVVATNGTDTVRFAFQCTAIE